MVAVVSVSLLCTVLNVSKAKVLDRQVAMQEYATPLGKTVLVLMKRVESLRQTARTLSKINIDLKAALDETSIAYREKIDENNALMDSVLDLQLKLREQSYDAS